MSIWRIGSKWGDTDLRNVFKSHNIAFAGDVQDRIINEVEKGDLVAITHGQPIIGYGYVECILPLTNITSDYSNEEFANVHVIKFSKTFWKVDNDKLLDNWGLYEGAGKQFHNVPYGNAYYVFINKQWNSLLLKEEYVNLFNTVSNRQNEIPDTNVSVFTHGKGKDYNNGLMICGRAVNGWHNVEKSQINQPKYINEFLLGIDKDNLDWVIKLFNQPKVGEWNPRTSAFWKVAHKIASRVYNDNSYEVLNNIVWTNLYKISKPESGNPTETMIQIQRESAFKILKLEIEILQPKVLIMFTSSDWANSFIDFLKPYEKNNKDSSEFQFIEYVARYKNTFIIVTQHPMTRPEEPHALEIINEIKRVQLFNL